MDSKWELQSGAHGWKVQLQPFCTAILIVLNPNKQGTVLKCTSIGLIVRHGAMGPVGQINDITKLIMHTHSLLAGRQSSDNACRTFCIIMGDYGSHMGFATDLLFCTAYPLSFVHKDDPTQITFKSQQNHPTFFTVDVLMVCQLLAQDCPLHVSTCEGQTSQVLPPYSQGSTILARPLSPDHGSLHGHGAPYCNPRSGEEAPFLHHWNIHEYGHTILWHSWGFRSVYG